MKGYPKYRQDEHIKFRYKDQFKEGIIAIIDKYGTYDNLFLDVSYDLYVEEENMIYKHVTESDVMPMRLEGKEIDNCFSTNEKGYIIPINLDFDGCCVEHCYPDVGATNGNVVSILQRWIKDYNVGLILHTSRGKNELEAALKWFSDNNICLWGIYTNPTQHTWTDSKKSYGFFIDDMCVGIPLISEEGKRDRVDWDKLVEIFEPKLKQLANYDK